MDNYTLIGNSYVPTEGEVELITSLPPKKSQDWDNAKYGAYKTNLKKHTLLQQIDRCAYCRREVETDGYYEPLEHIVAKSLKPTWLLEPKNLVVTCNTCNNLKNDEQTLTDDFLAADDFPISSQAFKIFQPHFDIWSNHLRYDDEIFLIAVPGSKGAETIKTCKLFRYHVIVNRVKELRKGQQSQAKKIIQRLKDMKLGSEEGQHMLLAVDHLLDRMEDKVGFAEKK